MPLTRGQIAALKTIAAGRDPESYVAGSTPLNRSQARYSADIDIFNDREERVAEAASRDAAALAEAGFTIDWRRRAGAVYALVAMRDGESAKLEWVTDSDYRFFPAVPDPLFGFMLHPVDLAINKALAAGNRRELRDLIDLVAIDRTILTLGPVIWAAVEKAPGFTPEGLIAEIRRNAFYPAEEWRAIAASHPIDPAETMTQLRAALDAADDFVAKMPTDKAGLLFIAGGEVIEPDPARLDDYTRHAGRRRGHWPSDASIITAMMERYRPA